MSTCTQPEVRCPRCGETKGRDQFGKNARRPCGLQCWCKACRAETLRIAKQTLALKRATLKVIRYEKTCSTCRRLLPESEYTNHAEKSDGLFNECHKCKAERARRNKYGVTREEFAALRCHAVCQMPGCGSPLAWDKSTHIDHCHTTGKVRTVLCTRCNAMLGFIEKTPHLVQPMLEYIARHRGLHESA